MYAAWAACGELDGVALVAGVGARVGEEVRTRLYIRRVDDSSRTKTRRAAEGQPGEIGSSRTGDSRTKTGQHTATTQPHVPGKDGEGPAASFQVAVPRPAVSAGFQACAPENTLVHRSVYGLSTPVDSSMMASIEMVLKTRSRDRPDASGLPAIGYSGERRTCTRIAHFQSSQSYSTVFPRGEGRGSESSAAQGALAAAFMRGWIHRCRLGEAWSSVRGGEGEGGERMRRTRRLRASCGRPQNVKRQSGAKRSQFDAEGDVARPRNAARKTNISQLETLRPLDGSYSPQETAHAACGVGVFEPGDTYGLPISETAGRTAVSAMAARDQNRDRGFERRPRPQILPFARCVGEDLSGRATREDQVGSETFHWARAASGVGRLALAPCKYDYHRRQKLKAATSTSPATAMSSTSPATSSTSPTTSSTSSATSSTSPATSSTSPTTSSTSSATSTQVSSQSQTATRTSGCAAPLSSLWTENQAIGALLLQKQDEMRRLQATGSHMQTLEALANSKKTVLFHVWAKPNQSAIRRSVLVKSHPIYCLEQLPHVLGLFPEGTTLYQVYNAGASGDCASWDDVEVSAGRSLKSEEYEVCVRVCGLHDDQCLGLSTVVDSLRSSSTSSTTTPVVRTPKRSRSPSRASPSDDCSYSPSKRILSVPIMKTNPTRNSRTSSHTRKCSISSRSSTTGDGDVEDAADEPMLKRPRRNTVSPNFPSQFPFSTVYNFVSIAEQSEKQPQQDMIRAAEEATGLKCGKTTYGDIKKLLRQGCPEIWKDFGGRQGADGLWTVYKHSVAQRPATSTLPWCKKGLVLDTGMWRSANSYLATSDPASSDYLQSLQSHSKDVNDSDGPYHSVTTASVPLDHPAPSCDSQPFERPSQPLLPGTFPIPMQPFVDTFFSPVEDPAGILDQLDDYVFDAGQLEQALASSHFLLSLPNLSSEFEHPQSTIIHDDLLSFMSSQQVTCQWSSPVPLESTSILTPSDILAPSDQAYFQPDDRPATETLEQQVFPNSSGTTIEYDHDTDTPMEHSSMTPSTAESTAFSGLLSRYGSWTLSSSTSEPLDAASISTESSLTFALAPGPL
ncbi:hypothetical protein L227DRAFT_566492 [Lentinus tigrinus ALCF2SS1-6]|uniref:Uncharacterized protein n=1 Tax=Lentinus tigrinus ALCF2SS1-6 TaxID=1328759 RepID=A0A5C2RXM7_9APHY|nr:hypothetical protein L227DRAFT_566492 [Lentinus tigrinus ALCF2SS1-6]